MFPSCFTNTTFAFSTLIFAFESHVSQQQKNTISKFGRNIKIKYYIKYLEMYIQRHQQFKNTILVCCILFLLSRHNQVNGCKDNEKNAFWQNIDEVMQEAPENRQIIIKDNLHGHVGKGWKKVNESWGFEERDEAGKRILKLANDKMWQRQ